MNSYSIIKSKYYKSASIFTLTNTEMTTLSQQTSEASSTYSYLTHILLVFPHHCNSCLPVYNKFTALAKISELSPSFFIAFLRLPEGLSISAPRSTQWHLNTAQRHWQRRLAVNISFICLGSEAIQSWVLGFNIWSTDLLLDTHRCHSKLQCVTIITKFHLGFSSSIYLQCPCTSLSSI